MEMEWHGDRGTGGAGDGDDDGDEYRGGTWRGVVALIGRGGISGTDGKGDRSHYLCQEGFLRGRRKVWETVVCAIVAEEWKAALTGSLRL